MSRGFRLAAVERMRARAVEDAGRALAQARRAVAEAIAGRDRLRLQLADCVPPARATQLEVWTAARRRELLRERIADADDEIARLGVLAGQARDHWLAARTQLRAVEALHERYRRGVRAEQDRQEQRLVDDLAAVRHRGPSGDPVPSGLSQDEGGEPA